MTKFIPTKLLVISFLMIILIANTIGCSSFKTTKAPESPKKIETITEKLPQTSSPEENGNITEIEEKPDNQPPVILPDDYLGHFPYEESPADKLVNMGKYYHRTEYLHEQTAEAFKKMKADAQAQGVELVLMSGFRGVEKQKELFEKQVQRRGSKEAAAKLSAPPGYSEHHTGYALDIGDAKEPKKDFKFEFESTQAYQWLIKNGEKYGFELSFPKDNFQGVSFEPWHWRYVGSAEAQAIFPPI